MLVTIRGQMVDPLKPNISMHILHTVLYTFSYVLPRRICLTIKASLVGDHFFYSPDLSVRFKGDLTERNWMLVIPRC